MGDVYGLEHLWNHILAQIWGRKVEADPAAQMVSGD